MGIGLKELLIILVIIVLLFGTKKLKTLGTDLGAAIKGFKKSMGDDEQKIEEKDKEVIEGQVEQKQADEQRRP
jgi:sec-independent protein translocase protein TatA